MQTKPQFRQQMRKARRDYVAGLPAVTRALILRRLPTPVLGLIPPAAVIGLYHATADEAPTPALAQWLTEQGHTLVLPWFADRNATMHFRQWLDPFADDLPTGPYGPQPDANAPVIVPDVLLMPLLAFTPQGARLGQGGGHYDRWLTAHPDAVAIGLAWDMQCLDNLPTEPHDRMMQAIITPTRYYECQI